MTLECKNCGDTLGDVRRAGQIDFSQCPSCGTLHRLDPISSRPDGEPYIQAPIRLPHSVAVARSNDGMAIVVRGSRRGVTVGLVTSAVLASLAAVSIMATPEQWPDALHTYLRMIAAPILSIVALALFVGAIGLLTSSQQILVDGYGVCIRYSSAFGKRFRNLWAQDLRLVAPIGPGPYGVLLHTKHDAPILLVEQLESPEQALFIAYQLETWLLKNKATAHDRDEARRRALAKQVALKQGKVGVLLHTLVDQPAQHAPAKSGIELACGRCGAPVAEEAIHRTFQAAVCAYCGNVFDLPPGPDGAKRNYAPEYSDPFLFTRGDASLELTKGAQREEGGGRFTHLRSMTLAVAVACLMAAAAYGVKAVGSGLGNYALIFLAGATPHLLLMGYELSRTLRRPVQRIQVNKLGILIDDSYLPWQSPAKINAAAIRNVFAYTNATDPSVGACLLIETVNGETLATFELPSPWHALHLAQETRRLLNI